MGSGTSGVAAASADARWVPDALRPPPGSPRFPLVDGLRAVAVLLVFAFHVAGWESTSSGRWWEFLTVHADIGVTLFFVISGFLLFRPFAAAWVGGRPRPSARRYARRRLLRIVPAYWVALTLLAVVDGIGGVFTGRWWVFYGFLQIYRMDWLVPAQGMQQAWSLCVEMSFYLALPLLALGLARLPGRTPAARLRAAAGAIAALVVASLAFRDLASGHGALVAVQTLPGIFTWFAGGMLLALASIARDHGLGAGRALDGLGRHAALCWTGALALYLLIGTVAHDVDAPNANVTLAGVLTYLGYTAVSVLLAAPVVVPTAERTLPGRLLAARPMAWIGLVSYGVFLWHFYLIHAVGNRMADGTVPDLGFAGLAVVALAASFVFAAVSYHLLERPILRFKERAAR